MISSPPDGSNGSEKASSLCPRCHVHLKGHFLEDASVEFCPKCGGMWISREDFTRSIKRTPPPDLPKEEPPDAEKPIWAESPLACPRCGGNMAKAVYDYSSGIKVDRCDRCRGIWLDRGELGRLRAYTQRKIPEEQLLMARLQAETVKRRLEAKYFAQESRSWWGGLSLRALVERLRDLIGLQSRGR